MGHGGHCRWSWVVGGIEGRYGSSVGLLWFVVDHLGSFRVIQGQGGSFWVTGGRLQSFRDSSKYS